MEAIRKQASKLREQVARQQQAVLRQFGGGGYGGSDTVITDEEELHRHQKLEKLYISTRSAKHFQRDIVRGVEGYIVTGSKQVEIGTKLCEDSRKYGSGNTCTSGNTLTRASLNFANARAQMEKERGNLLKAFGTQVAEPLRAMVMGAPLEDARHLAQRYDRMRQEAEAQTIEVSKRQAKVRENPGNPELVMKLESAEAKLQDLKSNMTILGKEATSAMAAVEDQQQNQTLQRLITLVEAERSYHQRILEIIERLEGEMRFEQQRIEAPQTPQVENIKFSPPPSYEEAKNEVNASQMHNGTSPPPSYEEAKNEVNASQMHNRTSPPPSYEEAKNEVNASQMHNGTSPPPSYEEANKVNASQMHNGTSDAMGYFLGEVMFPYQSDSNFELSLSVGDYVVIREVTSSGWAEGECKGKAGWFPYDYIERRDRVLATKVIEVF